MKTSKKGLKMNNNSIKLLELYTIIIHFKIPKFKYGLELNRQIIDDILSFIREASGQLKCLDKNNSSAKVI